MKKQYIKPSVYFESFGLMEHIAGNCIVNDGFTGAHHRDSRSCRYTDDNLALFYSSGNGCDTALFTGFTDDEISEMISNNSIEALGIVCYNSFLTTSSLFAS